MYAVIATGGKQYKVSEGDVITIERLPQEAGDTVTFDQVLAIGGDDFTAGTPLVDGATVEGTILRNGRAKKIIVYRFKAKKGYHKKTGHRQNTTTVRITSIKK